MHVLLTNDDGIDAEGLFVLQKEIRKIADVTIVAPDRERSSVGHGITLSQPLWSKKVSRGGKFYGYATSGTPADCIKIALGVILKKKPDLVIAGINPGSNEGYSVFYSGTVAGAREGAIMGIPAMAVSLTRVISPNFSYAGKVAARLARLIAKNKLPAGTFLNVNVPSLNASAIKGIRVTRQGPEPIYGKFSQRYDPSAREYLWLSAEMPPLENDLNNDTYALAKGYVAVTPVHCDLTDDAAIQALNRWKLA